jgi:hypothetical protein
MSFTAIDKGMLSRRHTLACSDVLLPPPVLLYTVPHYLLRPSLKLGLLVSLTLCLALVLLVIVTNLVSLSCLAPVGSFNLISYHNSDFPFDSMRAQYSGLLVIASMCLSSL